MAGPSVANLIVRVGADISQLGRALTQAEGQINGFAANTEAAGVALTRLALVAGATGVAILAGLGLAVSAAAEAQAAQEALANAILTSGRAIDKSKLANLAKELQNVTKFSDESILTIQRLLVTFGATEQQVLRLTPLMLDLSTRLGVDLETTTRSFTRALAGNDVALKRLLGKMGEGIDLSGNLDASLLKLEQRFKGAAQAAGSTFLGALARLRNAFSELREAFGAPLLQPLTFLVNKLADVVFAISELARATPIATRVIVLFAGAVGLLMVGGSGVLALVTVLKLASGTMAVMVPILDALIARTFALSLNVAVLNRIIGVMALKFLGLVGIAITVGLAIGEMINRIEGVSDAVTFSFLQLGRFFATLRGDKVAVDNYNRAMEDFVNKQKAGDAATARLDARLHNLADTFEQVAAAAKLVSLEAQAAAAARAAAELAVPGRSEADIKAIEVNRQRRVNAAVIAEKRKLVQKIQRDLDEELDAKEQNFKKEQDLRTQLAQATFELNDAIVANAVDAANKVVEAEKQLAEQSLANKRAAAEQELEVRRSEIEDERAISEAAGRADEAVRQRRLQVIRLEEELRLGMLRRVADIEQRLSRQIIDTRATLLNIQQSKLEAEAIRSAARRAQLVRDGFITEEQARTEAENEAAAREAGRIDQEVRLLQDRQKAVQQQFDREVQVAQVTLESKLRILEAETNAKKASLGAEQKLREASFTASVALAQAETDAKIALLALEFEAQKRILDLKAIELEQTGDIEAAQNLRAALDAQAQGFADALKNLKAAQAQRKKTTDDVIAQTRRESAEQKAAIDQQAASQRALLGLEFSDALFVAMETRNERLQDIAQRGAALGVDIATLIAGERARLQSEFEKGNITAETRDRRLRDLESIEGTLTKTTDKAVQAVKNSVAQMDTVWKGFVDSTLVTVKPIEDFFANVLRLIKESLTLASGLGTTRPVVVGALAGAGGGEVNNTFQFNNVDMNLSVDEAALLERLIKKMLGPEGDRIFRNQQGAQSGGKGGAK